MGQFPCVSPFYNLVVKNNEPEFFFLLCRRAGYKTGGRKAGMGETRFWPKFVWN